MAACTSDPAKESLGKDFAKTLQKQLIEAKAGDIIKIPEGSFQFKRPLSFNDVPDVTIKGAGKGKNDFVL